MKRIILFVGVILVSILGTLLHFLFDWTNSTFIALFSAVNESTWEHMKIFFFPMLFFAIIEKFFIGGEYKNFWCVKIKSTLLGLILIPIIFYTLRGVFGTTPDWINITIFFLSVIISFVYENRHLEKSDVLCKYSEESIFLFCVISIIFFLFTFFPPEIPLFKDPISNTYGLKY